MKDIKKLLKNKNFLLFTFCTAQSALGASLTAVALSFLVLHLTGSASKMSIVLAAKFSPLIFTPLAATFLDRNTLKSPLSMSFFARGLIMLLICVGVKLHLLSFIPILLLTLMLGICRTFFRPASRSLIPLLIEDKVLTAGNSLIRMVSQSAALAGFAFGGLLVSWLGTSSTIGIEGILCLAAGTFILFIKLPNKGAASIAQTFTQDLLFGIRYLVTRKMVVSLFLMSFLLNFIIAPLLIMLPLYMNNIGKGAFGYGLFMTSTLVGMLLGSIILAAIGDKIKNSNGVILGWTGSCFTFFFLDIFTSYHWMLVFAVLFGASVAFVRTNILVILQRKVSEEVRARVIGVGLAVVSLGIPLSLLTFSYYSRYVNMHYLFMISSILSLFFVFWSKRLFAHQ